MKRHPIPTHPAALDRLVDLRPERLQPCLAKTAARPVRLRMRVNRTEQVARSCRARDARLPLRHLEPVQRAEPRAAASAVPPVQAPLLPPPELPQALAG